MLKMKLPGKRKAKEDCGYGEGGHAGGQHDRGIRRVPEEMETDDLLWCCGYPQRVQQKDGEEHITVTSYFPTLLLGERLVSYSA